MPDEYVQSVLLRAGQLQQAELAARLLGDPARFGWRAALAAGITALLALWPSLSAAAALI